MKLIIQIPCLNEEKTLAATVKALPEVLPGIDVIELLLIDDGSTDRSVEIARSCGVHHIVRLTTTQGLARAFATGIDASLAAGADIIVNTDADNQYCGEDVAALVRPIIDRQADIVVGTRDMKSIRHFSPAKKLLQAVGSSFVRTASGTSIPDATSGFRAYSRNAAMRLHVLSDFTYTLETIIQAGADGMAISYVPVRTNDQTRKSRLVSSTGNYIGRSIGTIIRIYTMYKPLKVFFSIGGIIFSIGLFGLCRFLWFYITLPSVQTGHVQSLIVSGVFLLMGFQIILYGLMADMTAKNRKLVEEVLVRVKRMELDNKEQ